MKTRSDFSQFTATPVTYQDAFRLIGADLMHQLKLGRITEALLPTGAKLFFYDNQFHIFSYASDGRDGWNIYRALHATSIADDPTAYCACNPPCELWCPNSSEGWMQD